MVLAVRKLQGVIVDALENVKAQDIRVFDTEHLSSLFERVIVASGTSNRQTRALASSVRDAVRAAGEPHPRVEGEENGEWIIVDCGPAVVHVMQPAIRTYYHLEELWGEKPVKATAAAKKASGLVKAGGASPAAKASPAGRPVAAPSAKAARTAKPAGTSAEAFAKGPAKAASRPKTTTPRPAARAAPRPATAVAPRPSATAAPRPAAKTTARKSASPRTAATKRAAPASRSR